MADVSNHVLTDITNSQILQLQSANVENAQQIVQHAVHQQPTAL